MPARSPGRRSHDRCAAVRTGAARFIRAALASALNVDALDIDEDQDFDALGLPSLEAVMLTGDLEDWLGRPVDAEAALDHASVARLARHLAQS